MSKTSKKKFLRVIIHLIFPLLFISLGALGFWFYQNYLNQKSTKIEASTEFELRQKIEDLQKGLQVAKTASSSVKIEKVCSGIEKELPVITYEAEGLFSESEKNNLKTYVINPFFDYNNEQSLEFVAMVISKENQGSSEYSVLAINKNGGYHSFLIKRNTWWVPTCMIECPYTPAFKTKYPQIVKLTNPTP